MNEERDDLIILIDENGDEVEAEHIDTIEYRGGEYVVLLPKDGHVCDDEDCDEEEVVILKVEHGADGAEDTLVAIDDEEEQDAIFDIFTQRMEEEEFDEEDEDEEDDE